MKFINSKPKNPHKIKRRYRLSFQSENTLNELWSIKLTRTKVVLASIVVVASITALISYIIVGTPLRTLLPGYLKSEQRAENIVNAFRLDSLERAVAANDAYFGNLKKILNGNIDVASKRDTIDSGITVDSLMQESQREKDFVNEYDEQERFNLSILTPIAAEGLVFASPVQGKIEESDKSATTVHVRVPKSAPVYSVYNGTVINVSVSLNGTNIMIQHPSGFISVYGNLDGCYVARGSKVQSSQAIGVAGSTPVQFELWHEGASVAPQEYISF